MAAAASRRSVFPFNPFPRLFNIPRVPRTGAAGFQTKFPIFRDILSISLIAAVKFITDSRGWIAHAQPVFAEAHKQFQMCLIKYDSPRRGSLRKSFSSRTRERLLNSMFRLIPTLVTRNSSNSESPGTAEAARALYGLSRTGWSSRNSPNRPSICFR